MTIPAWISEVQALSTPAIAAAVGVIAWQQFRVAHQKLRLDLFDRRYAVLEVLMREAVTALNQNESALFDERLFDMNQRLTSARFLFDGDTFDYLNSVATAILELRHSTWTLKQSAAQSKWNDQQWLLRHNERLSWLLSNMNEMPKRLEKFLKVDDNLSFSLKPSLRLAELVAEAGTSGLGALFKL